MYDCDIISSSEAGVRTRFERHISRIRWHVDGGLDSYIQSISAKHSVSAGRCKYTTCQVGTVCGTGKKKKWSIHHIGLRTLQFDWPPERIGGGHDPGERLTNKPPQEALIRTIDFLWVYAVCNLRR